MMITEKITQKINPFGDVFPINSLPADRLVDAGIDRIVNDADIKFEACQRYYEQVDADILFFFSDIAIQAEAMGAPVSMSADTMPCIAAPAQRIQTPNPSDFGRMRVNSRVTRRMKACFPHKSVSTLVYGPFTVAGQIIGEQILLRKIIQDADEIREILSKTFQVARAYADCLLDAGADIFWISDPLAALLPPSLFWEFAGEYLAQLFHLYVEMPSIIHICGDTVEIIPQMIQTGVWGISFDQCMDLMSIEDNIPQDVFIIGNLDPAEKVEQATSEEINVSVMDLANLMGAKPNYVMSSGCALSPATPLENVQTFVNTARHALNLLKPNAGVINSLCDAVFEGNCDLTHQWAENAVKDDVPVLTVIDAGLMRSIRKGSVLYEAKKNFCRIFC